MTILALCAVGGALLSMLVVALHNAFYFPHLHATTDGGAASALPGVSILIPARNEAANIGQTVRALLAQDYSQFEVIVLDDGSDDNTGLIARAAGEGDRRLAVVSGEPLPATWSGKNWACHQLAQVAQFDHLLFTDADVQWRPHALAAIMAEMADSKADLLTVWPTQLTVTWGERLVVPLMAFAVLAYLPVGLAHESQYPLAAAANGQCMFFRRQAYCTVGGHAALRNAVVEDVQMAQAIKAYGLRLRMADGNGLVQARMYDSWAAVRNGFAKNILAGHGNSPLLLLLSTLFHLLCFVGPWLWLSVDFGWAAALIGLGIAVRALTAFTSRQRFVDALFMPVSVLLMTWIAGQALWWHWRFGGPLWKGRVIRNA